MAPIAIIVILGIIVGLIIYFLVTVYRTPGKIETIAALVDRGKTAAAVRIARTLVRRAPHNGELHYLLGLAYLGGKKPELAFAELKTVNELGSFGSYCPEPAFRHNMAALYEEFGEIDEALKEWLILTRIEPVAAENWYSVGRLFEQRGDPERASSYYRKTIEINPDHAEAHFRLGVHLYTLKATAAARAEFDATVRVQPNNPRAHLYLGRLFRENREYLVALHSFEVASRDKELKVTALIERGACYLSGNDVQKAASELDRAIRLAPDESSAEALEARYLLAQCYERTRSLEQAIQQWEAIHQKKPGYRDVEQKLVQYQDVRTDDRIMDYLTVSDTSFEETCRSMVSSMGLTVRDVAKIPDGFQLVAEEEESKWRSGRRLPVLMRFFRTQDPIQETRARALYEEMKKLGMGRGVIVTSSGVSRSAEQFLESRPVEVVTGRRLKDLLKSAELSRST